MTERLLHFLWQYQYFDKKVLLTTVGELLEIITAGEQNSNQGPDFLGGKVRVGDTT